MTRPEVVLEHDHIVLDIDVYEFFMAKQANDALRLYLHLLYVARRQGTHSVWANLAYLQAGTGMGREKVRAARRFLIDNDLIAFKQEKPQGDDGKMTGAKVYITIRGYQKPGGPVNREGRCAASEMLQEEREVLQEESEDPAAVAAVVEPANPKPAKRKPKVRSLRETELFHAVGDVMVERGGKWSGQKEPVSLWKLVDWSKQQDPEHYDDLLKEVVRTYWLLHEGRAPRMSFKDKEWWSHRPFTPSMLLANLHSVLEWMRAKQKPLGFEELEKEKAG